MALYFGARVTTQGDDRVGPLVRASGAKIVRHEVALYECGGRKAAIRRVSTPVPNPGVRRWQRRGAKPRVTSKEGRTIRLTGLGEDWHGDVQKPFEAS